ncbi:MAG: flagellar hook-associated protein FlgL [Pseudomonadota bacterium]
MRVSAQATFKDNVTALQRLQTTLNDLQQQIATGRRINRPSDDPLGAARALDLQQSITRLDQFDKNINQATNRLRLQEESLTTVTEFIQRARELTLQASNATQTNETRSFIAVELRGVLDAALGVANSRDNNGQYLFGGFQTSVQPYTRTGDTFTYNGDQGRREVQVGTSRRIADSEAGDRIFGRLREGNGQVVATPAAGNTGTATINTTNTGRVASYNYERFTIAFTAPDSFEVRDDGGTVLSSGAFTNGDEVTIGDFSFTIAGEPETGDAFEIGPSGQTDVFSVIENIAATLAAGTSNGQQNPEFQTAMDAGIAGLDQALQSVLTVRSETGIRLGVTETELDNNASTKLVLQSALADVQELDFTEAISALSQQASVLEAAQQSFVRIQGLSLFNFL